MIFVDGVDMVGMMVVDDADVGMIIIPGLNLLNVGVWR